MEKSLEDKLFNAVILRDIDVASNLISKGADPNKIAYRGKTSLGEAAAIGNIGMLKLLIDASKASPQSRIIRKRHKRKLKSMLHDKSVVKCKNISERTFKDYYRGHCSMATTQEDSKVERNQGYFVFIHSEGSSSDESKRSSLISPISPSTLTPSPQDLEWDEEIDNVAPTTSEDDTWSSMYKWYASILECTGAAIASESYITNGIDQQDTYMRTALHYASEIGHERAVKLLVDSGAKVEVTASDGGTPLHLAVLRKHIQIVKMLLVAGSNVNCKTHEKMTPLHLATSRGHLDMVKLLVNHGAYLEARDTDERTPLHLAAGLGHVDVVQYMVMTGANVNGEEIHGFTPLCEAVWQRHVDVVEILLNSGARITHSHKLLHNAILQRQEEIVKMLANHGGGINLYNENGDTPLLLAVRLSQLKIARVLLEKGANVNACSNITGASALHIAVENIDSPSVFEELLMCLLEYKIDTNATALTGDTALNRALLLDKDNAAMLLIRHGADVNACDLQSCGLDNLTIASRRLSPHLVSMLIKAGHCTTIPDPSIVPRPGSIDDWLYHACRNPLKLTDLSRIRIRSMRGNVTLATYISGLPLPKSLLRFLMMNDEGYNLRNAVWIQQW